MLISSGYRTVSLFNHQMSSAQMYLMYNGIIKNEEAEMHFCVVHWIGLLFFIYLQLWPKISHPCNSVRKCNPFFQKIVAVANVLVLTCVFIYFLFALE